MLFRVGGRLLCIVFDLLKEQWTGKNDWKLSNTHKSQCRVVSFSLSKSHLPITILRIFMMAISPFYSKCANTYIKALILGLFKIFLMNVIWAERIWDRAERIWMYQIWVDGSKIFQVPSRCVRYLVVCL